MSLARQHFQKHSAKAAAESAAEFGTMKDATAYELQLMQLNNDRSRLKQIQSTENKVKLKATLLPIYAPYIEGILEAQTGVQDEIVTEMMIWNIDVGNFNQALLLAEYVLQHGLALGSHIMSGISVGLETGFPGLKDKFTRVLEVFNPNAANALQQIDIAPALSKVRPAQMISSSQRGDIVVQGDTIALHIHQAPGQNLHDLQRMVENILNKRDQQKLARARNSFLDQA